MAPLPRPVTNTKCSIPAALASSTAYWISGLSTTGSISLGTALVAGRKRVPKPATGKTALRTGFGIDPGEYLFVNVTRRARDARRNEAHLVPYGVRVRNQRGCGRRPRFCHRKR